MFFKRVALQGFKSFVEKTNVDFPSGITCIVGPNGSGKSNILDGIRWVFGEQSAKELRGTEMDDIIFAGSENRKPSGFAQVSLTLDDLSEDITSKWGTFSEITVSRKYYKTGEREYLINNRRCKLKDIKEIFYDTGIGARSISIIEQGKVEKIIQSSPEELRLFFEESAGVVKFKERKKEAEKRLSQTKENLGRVNDIISEVKNNANQLSAQLEKLNEYKELQQRKKNYDLTYIYNTYKNYRDNLRHLNIKHDECLSNLNKNSEKLELLQQTLKEKQKMQSEIHHNYEECNENLIDLSEKANKTESEINILQNNIDGAEDTKNEIKKEINSTGERLKQLTEKADELKKSIEDVSTKKEEIEYKISETEDIIGDYEIQKDETGDELAECKEIYLDLTQNITNIRNDIYKNETDINNMSRNNEKLSNEKEEISRNIEMQENKKKKQDKAIQEVKEDLSSYNDTLVNYEQRIKDYDEKITDINNNLEHCKIEHSTFSKSLELYNEQLKTETFADSEDEEFLKRFNIKLLVDYLPGLDYEMLKELGDVLVIDISRDQTEHFFSKMSELKGSYRFVFYHDLDSFEKHILSSDMETYSENILRMGHLYRKYGDRDKSSVILKLKKDINEAESKYSDYGEKISYYEHEYKRLSDERATLEREKGDVESLKKNIEQKISSIENDLSITDKELSKDKVRMDVIDKEVKMYSREMQTLEKANKELNEKLNSLSSKQEGYDDELNELQEKCDFYDNKIDDYKDELSELKIEQRGFKEQLNSDKKQLHYINKDIYSASNRIASLKERMSKLMSVDVTNWQTSMENKKAELKKYKKDKMETEDRKRYLSEKIEEITEEISGITSSVDKQKSEISKSDKEYEKTYYDISQTKKQMSELKELYYEKYNSEDIVNELQEFEDKDFRPKAVKNAISAIEKSIEELGPLNMAADQEYQELSERLIFLQKQREDLENAINTIYELINDIDNNTIKQFNETFKSVRKHFLDIFKILFGDGKAELKLTDEDNMLTTGVEIFVQPPGKRLQNMNLLSGGEKAMTACTLLFAMFLHKPTPFCFLDEIDAPLDDANIGRFVKIVRQLSGNSQFVIISHNQKTIENADSLYGITMQEPGVSKILSVKLNKGDVPSFS